MRRFHGTKGRQIWLVILLLIGFLCSTSYYAKAGSEVRRHYGGEYRVPLASEPVTLDPALYTDIYAMNVAANIFDGLVEFDKNLNVVPAIAKVWKISRDHRTYTFRLRKGVRFHNGREVKADDFVFSFSRILSPEIKSPAASFFLNIVGAKEFREGKRKEVTGLTALDSYTLKVELEEPFAPFLSILAMINAKVVPKEAMSPDFGKQPVGTGPFRFRSWDPGKDIVLEANQGYFEGRPYLDSLRFRIYPNIEWEKIFADFEKGLLEQSIVPSNRYELVISDASYRKRYKLISKPQLNLVYIGMNAKAEPFKDHRVRQAIYYAVDRQKITQEITKRGSVPARGVLPPGIAGFDPNFRGYPYNPKKALELLAEAGYPEGRGLAPIEIWTVSKGESVRKELEAYKNYLAKVGLELVPRVAENWKEFLALINKKKVQMFYAAWYADYPDADNFLYVLFHSKSRINRMGYNNPEVDELLEQARIEKDYMQRVELYRDIQKRVMREAPIICQHVNSFSYLFQPWVKGVKLSHLGATYLRFKDIWFDQHKSAGNLLQKAKSNIAGEAGIH
jgi:oligopeptide transport system substrate-binding protein